MIPQLHLFDYSGETPEENIDIDTRLLQASNKAVKENRLNECAFLRFWESKDYFVCLGASNKAKTEVNIPNTTKDNIPILKRCSGGGTVVQGPGCMNYCVVLPISYNANLKSIDNTNKFIMNKTQKAIQAVLTTNDKVMIQGFTDLTINNIKFSGNAQRRLNRSILFHGSILYQFNIQKISDYLAFPSRHPKYRKKRSHEEFCQNINLTKKEIKASLLKEWQCKKTSPLSSKTIIELYL